LNARRAMKNGVLKARLDAIVKSFAMQRLQTLYFGKVQGSRFHASSSTHVASGLIRNLGNPRRWICHTKKPGRHP
jgi:hypothetical protein